MKIKIFIGITLVLFGVAVGIITKDLIQKAHYKQVEAYQIIGKIKINNDYINVREKPNSKTTKLFQAIKNEEYEYIEKFTEERGIFTWYKIKFSDRRIGWIANYEEENWLKEIN